MAIIKDSSVLNSQITRTKTKVDGSGPDLVVLMSWTQEFPHQNKYQDMGSHFGEIKTCDFQFKLDENIS